VGFRVRLVAQGAAEAAKSVPVLSEALA
jgi:hypothetical protein